MLTLKLTPLEIFVEETNSFDTIGGGTFRFENSLKAMALWESEYRIPFLGTELTHDQLRYYIQCMCLDDGLVVDHLDAEAYQSLLEYLSVVPSATTIQNEGKSPSKANRVTSEMIYAWMTAANVPFECDEWNFHRLSNLLGIISDQQTPDDQKKKMTRNEIFQQNADLNAQRKAAMNTKG